MGGCFKSKTRNAQLDDFENAIFKSKLARDDIKRYLKRMDTQSVKQRQLAKDLLKEGKKDRAKLALARSKAYETQVEVAQGQLNMLEEQIIQIEQSKMESQAINVLESGNNILKKLQNEINVEKWEKVSDDLSSIREQHNEIASFLQGYGVDQSQFDEEIDNELEHLMNSNKAMNKEDIYVDLPVLSDKKNIEIKQDKSNNKEVLLT